MFKLPKKPQSVFQAVGLSFNLYLSAFKAYFPIIPWIALLSFLPAFVIEFGQLTDAQLTLFAVGLQMFILIPILTPALLMRIDGVATGQTKRCALLKPISQHYIRFLIAGILLVLALFAGFIFLIIPGIYLAFALSLYLMFIIDGKQDAVDSLLSSNSLVFRYWFRNFAVLIIVVIVSALLILAAKFALTVLDVFSITLAGVLFSRPEIPYLSSIFLVVSIIIPAFIAPLLQSAIVVQYHNLKLRKRLREEKLTSQNHGPDTHL